MKIKHWITLQGRVEERLKIMDIPYSTSPLPNQPVGLVHVEIDEDNSNWPFITKLVEETNGTDMFDTFFSEHEILEAEWCRIIPIYNWGYPQPKAGWLETHETYDDFCKECGVFHQQKINFQIKKEPRLDKHHFLSLYWTYTLFARMEVFREFSSANLNGYEMWNAVIQNTNSISQLIAQIHLPYITGEPLLENLEYTICKKCGTKKLFPHMRGYMYFNKNLRLENQDFLLSQEWFGDGHSAYREILASKNVIKLILSKQWTGIRLKPIKLN